MKRVLTVISLVAILGCSAPVSAMEHCSEPNGCLVQPRQEKAVVERRYMPTDHRKPPKEIYHYHNSHKAGAVVGGIIAGAALAGIVTAIAD